MTVCALPPCGLRRPFEMIDMCDGGCLPNIYLDQFAVHDFDNVCVVSLQRSI
jgi:hypothetical protein